MKLVRRLLHKDTPKPESEALFKAIREGNVAEVRQLLDASSANSETYQRLSPLHFCSMSGNLQLLELLLERGASIEHLSDDGFTPLMRAVYYNRTEVVRTLVQAGADVNLMGSNGKTALVVACFRRKPKLISYLFWHYANVQPVSTPNEFSGLISADVLEFLQVLCGDRERLKVLWILLKRGKSLPQGLFREMLSYL